MTAEPAEMADLVARLRAEVSNSGDDFVCLTPLGGRSAQLRFVGRFENRDVVWDAELIALLHEPDNTPQFLDIALPTAQGIPIKIGLAVPRIDRPTVLKTIIMVRNYKRLRSGRHEFGPVGPTGENRSR